MIIIPTRVCNTNKCSYCWVLKKDFKINYFENNLDLEDFVEKIKIISNKTWDCDIRFFWWEPFLKFDIIKNIIKHLKKQNNNYNFIINTNLSLIKKQYLSFLKENNIKLIISCNWDLYSHSITRNTSKDQTFKLYENIKKIIQNNINYQINIVTTPKIVSRLHKNFTFIYNELWWKIFNLLPVNYNWWDNDSLDEFEKQLNIVKNNIKNNELNIEFINKKVNNNVSLFNSEITIDSDWKVYPSMVIIEKFFEKEKQKILVSDLNNSTTKINDDFIYYEKNNHNIYDQYINKIINNKFKDIIDNDSKSSKIFHNFLIEI